MNALPPGESEITTENVGFLDNKELKIAVAEYNARITAGIIGQNTTINQEGLNPADLTDSFEKEEDLVRFSIPENDGRFRSINAMDQGEGNFGNYYKVNKKTNTVCYIPGEHDMRALDNIDYYLEPVCKILDIRKRRGATGIKMVKPGRVFKTGDGRKIDPDHDHKIRIDFVT